MVNFAFGQVFWTENFGQDPGACSNQGQSAAGFASANGVWAITQTGVNAAQSNVWYVSATEAGFGTAGACGDGCIDTPTLTNRTLHISTSILGDLGAAYFETGFGITTSNTRAESPIIDCSGQSDIEMSFLYMAAGSASDLCTVTYFDGAAWSDLGVLAPTPNTCAPQGTWTNATFNLPASANNNPNVRIGFRWVNVDDGLASDPSVAIDDITLNQGGVVADLVADFSASETVLCVGDCISFTDLSTGPGIDSWTWTFDGAVTPNSTNQNPINICYDTPGSFTVTLLVSNALGDDDEFVAFDFVVVSDCPSGPEAAFTASETTICAGDCVDFTDTSTGTPVDWTWTFDGALTANSTDQNPTNVCYDIPGSYTVTLLVEDALGNDDELVSVDFMVVSDCPEPPEAAFTASETTICAGDCVDFTDTSSGTPVDWTWTFDGALTANSTAQNPTNVCYDTPGSYSVTLLVADALGNDDELVSVNLMVVSDCSSGPVASFTASETTICVDDCVDFTDTSIGNPVNWTWTFDGALTANSADQNPTNVCYDTPGSYTVTLLVTDALGEDSEQISLDFMVVADCSGGPVAAFDASETTICAGDCIDFTDASLVNPTDWFWSFPGSDTPLSSDQNPTQVCYDNPGQYNVSLIVSDGTINDNLTEVNFITVEDCISPPAVSFETENSVICVGDCIDFTNTSTGPGQSAWSWTLEGADPEASFNQNPINVCYVTPGTYDVTLQVTNPGGVSELTLSDYITVVDTCGPIAGFNHTSIVCRGQCYSFENISIGGTDYFWQFQGATPTTSTDENPQDICYLGPNGAFNITLTVTNEFGTSTSITQPVLVVNPPLVNAGVDQTITQGTSTTLSATGGNGSGTFLWQPYEDVSCFSCPSTQASPNETTEFIVYYQQAGGCQSSDTVTVFVNEVISSGLPNTFSPNGDGINDILYVRGNNVTQMSLIIYNRYGQQVFESNSLSVGWDGTMNGRDLNPGVFGYYLEVYFTDGTRQINKGDITLVR
jgi:gliding motility-associated-like protein